MPLVTAQETSELFAVLGTEHWTFEQVREAFLKKWSSSPSDTLRVLFTTLLFLQEGVIKEPAQKLSALHLLHTLTHLQPPGRNPFTPFLLQAVQDPGRPYPERYFIQSLLLEDKPTAGRISEVLQRLQSKPPNPLTPAPELLQLLQERESARSKVLQKAQPSPSSHEEVEALLTARVREGVPPPFTRLTPPVLPLQPGEVRWLHPELPHLLRWDKTMGQDQTTLQELQSLLKEALAGPLLPTQQQQVLKELEANKKLVLSLSLTPPSLPQLVEHNPAIAFEVLLRLIQLAQGNEYLPALVNMEMSLHSMEVINRLSKAVHLPSEFVHLYISNCIVSCQAAQEDKYVQTRRVRLVCVFLQSLIRNRIINVQDLSYEVQAFCIEFSRVKEAAALFRLLKTLENGNDPSSELPLEAASTSRSH